ncbi:MAG: trigger factor [Planctomycetota bacterium]
MDDQETETTEMKNTVTIEDTGPCKKKVVIEVPEEKIKEALDKEYSELGRDAIVPGFRKGRAPRRLLEKRFGKDIRKQVKLKLLVDAAEEAKKDNDLDVLGEPDIDQENIELPESGSLKFEFEIEVRPEFDLPVLENIPVEKVKFEVTDEQIAEEIMRLRKRMGLWAPVEDGSVAAGDQVIADISVKAEDEQEEQTHTNSVIFVRDPGFVGAVPVENLVEVLAGAKQGDVKKISTEVSKTYYDKQYRGKKVDVGISIKDIKRLEAAGLDENFFRQVGVSDEQELKAKVHEAINSRLEEQQRSTMAGQIYQYLLDNTEFDLPLDVVAAQSAQILQRRYSELLMRGLDRKKVEERMEQLRGSSDDQAKKQLKLFFVMSKVAEKLDIEVSEEEINGQIARIALQRGQRPERVREQLTREGTLSQFALQLRENKCVERLLESAKVAEIDSSAKDTKKTEAVAKKKTSTKSKVVKAKDSTKKSEEKQASKKPVKEKPVRKKVSK